MTQKIKNPGKKFYKQHLQEYAQYSVANDWLEWCTKIAFLRGMRALYILQDFTDTDARILDLGCSIGLSLGIIAQKYTNTYGCDIEKEAIKATGEMLDEVQAKSKLSLYDGLRLPYRKNYFDAILNLEVIEHAQDPDIMLKEAARVLKKNGVLIITTANKWWPYEPHYKLPFLSYLPGKLADLYLQVSGKGESYADIKLPGYVQFRKQVEKYFIVEDITLELIKNYEKYGLGKERGLKIIIAAKFLKLIDALDNKGIPYIKSFIEYVLIRASLGWVFVGRRKK